MIDRIEEIAREIAEFNESNAAKMEEFRIKYLGSKGVIKSLFQEMKSVPKEQIREVGQRLNELKNLAQQRLDEVASQQSVSEVTSGLDVTRPGRKVTMGGQHPIDLVRAEIIDIFQRIGFTLSEGPELEDDWHNFSALNFPPDHPARDMQDTFFVERGEEEIALRTHTSSVQVRVMESSEMPVRTISPGRVFRNEAISARSHCIFHQVEGLYIDKGVSMADLKQTLLHFSREMFGPDTEIRMRPSYFPFTEPSVEVDVSCVICSGKGCNVCKYTGFLEIMGAGMVDPNVLEGCGIDSEVYTGFAFGMGIERIAMLRYGVKDIRYFFENHLEFLEQFQPVS